MSAYLPAVWSSIGSDTFDRQIDRIFDDAVRAMATDAPGWGPACDAWEDRDGFYVEVALPGWEPKDVTLEVNNQILAIKGARKEETAREITYHLHEIGRQPFVRLFKLPASVDHEKANATQKNGLLAISFPKKEEAKVRQILIEG